MNGYIKNALLALVIGSVVSLSAAEPAPEQALSEGLAPDAIAGLDQEIGGIPDLQAILDGLAGLQQQQGSAPVNVPTPVDVHDYLNNTTDLPFLIFKSALGGKYPFTVKVDPRDNTMTILLFGTFDTDEEVVKPVKNAKGLENLKPLRLEKKYADLNRQVVRSYQGYRETYATTFLEWIFKETGLLVDYTYEGTPLIDEYRSNMPMKFVLANAAEFTALKTYLQTNMQTAGIAAGALPKPVLLLEFMDSQAQLGQDDVDFINTYFTPVNRQDAVVKKFFDKAQKRIDDLVAQTARAKVMLEKTMTETLFREFEELTEGGDVKKLFTGLVVLTATVVFKQWLGKNWHSLWHDAADLVTDKAKEHGTVVMDHGKSWLWLPKP